MSVSNTIHTLTRITVKPVQWTVYQDIDSAYRLSASYVEPERGEFFDIVTARGQTKIYKSTKALLHDVRRVDINPNIQFHFQEQ